MSPDSTRPRQRRPPSTYLWPLTAALAACLFLFPLLAMVSGSLRTPGLPPPRSFEVIPDPATLEGYRQALRLAPLGRATLNSLAVAAVFTPIAVVAASWAGFAISQAARPARRRLTAILLTLLMVPVTAVWIPRFVIFEAAGLVGTYAPLVAPALLGGTPFLVLLYVLAFRRIPRDVFDAARLEGAGPLRIWARVAMPLSRATTVAVAVLAFVLSWSNFIDALLYLRRQDQFTAPLVLRYVEQLGSTNWPVLLAASAMVTAPAVAVFAIAQRSFARVERGIGWLGR